MNTNIKQDPAVTPAAPAAAQAASPPAPHPPLELKRHYDALMANPATRRQAASFRKEYGREIEKAEAAIEAQRQPQPQPPAAELGPISRRYRELAANPETRRQAAFYRKEHATALERGE